MSRDTWWAKNNIDLSPEDWLLRYMQANIDCVAVTDHNSGAWIDRLKDGYEGLRSRAADGSAPSGFRRLTLFPGVEISVQGGFHLLAIFDPATSSSDIDSLLGSVGYRGTKGDSNGVTRRGAAEVVNEILQFGGVPVPAHVDRSKGLLQVREDGSLSPKLDANSVRQVLDETGILAMEVIDRAGPRAAIYDERGLSWAEVLGTDSHTFRDSTAPGSRYTWVKMAKPSIEGLRLALLDGNDVSICRSDDGEFEPFKTPKHFITRIEVDSARFMGNGTPERLDLTPFYNALIGGRGTGKSTVVQALRLAYRRGEDLERLSADSEVRRQFNSFAKAVKGRDGDGALRPGTDVRVELIREGVAHRLRWRQDGEGDPVEEFRGSRGWEASRSDVVSAERFPIRLLSQGQIAAMAGENRQALLSIIDEGAAIGRLHREFEEAKRTYFSQRAKLRELDGRLRERPETERKLAEADSKLAVLAATRHADVLQAHQRAERQREAIDGSLDLLGSAPDLIHALASKLSLDDRATGAFDALLEPDPFQWFAAAEDALGKARADLAVAADALRTAVERLGRDDRLQRWRQVADQARTDYGELQASLSGHGVADSTDFGDIVEERQYFKGSLRELDKIKSDRDHLATESEHQWQLVLAARQAISVARAAFVETTLHGNDFVRIEVVPFGFDAQVIERDLRELLGVQDTRFENDILRLEHGEPSSGLALELAQAEEPNHAKQKLIGIDESFGGQFRNFLDRKIARSPEVEDHMRCWFPEDDLRIEYNRGKGDWARIGESSQGQRSAALLAFLLAFGDEPLVLDQPEDDLDNRLVYDLIVRQIRENKLRRQLVIVTHNPNVVVNGDAEMVHSLEFVDGQCRVLEKGALQERSVRKSVCSVMEGGLEAFERRWARLGRGLADV